MFNETIPCADEIFAGFNSTIENNLLEMKCLFQKSPLVERARVIKIHHRIDKLLSHNDISWLDLPTTFAKTQAVGKSNRSCRCESTYIKDILMKFILY